MHYWVIRAGEGGRFFDEFIKHDLVAVGWDAIRRDLSKVKTKDELVKIYKSAYRNETKQQNSVNVSTLWRYLKQAELGDIVLAPNPLTRQVYIGKIKGTYKYDPKPLGSMFYKHRRAVSWEKEVPRDAFSQDMKHAMGGLLTFFNIDKYESEIEGALLGSATAITAKGRIKFPKKPYEEATIGEPIDFEGLTNAPIEENGVIFLFGKLHERMGIRIKAIRKGFPDAIGEVWIKDRLFPRSIEFEYKSSSFVQHGHLKHRNKCDIIVCWEHDWKDCPSDIFVIELKKEIENYIQ